MANVEKSRRGISWNRWFTDPAFRRGFSERREGLGFCSEFDTRSTRWQWMYEAGRLFAADRSSGRWKRMPHERKGVTTTLIKAYRLSLATKNY